MFSLSEQMSFYANVENFFFVAGLEKSLETAVIDASRKYFNLFDSEVL